MSDGNRAKKRSLSEFIATGFFSGYFPYAPGTAGSLVMFAILLLIGNTTAFFHSAVAPATLAMIVFFFGVVVTKQVLQSGLFGEGRKDPKQVVIDEFAGMTVATIGCSGSNVELLIAFIAFRFFDILKPPPIKQLEKMSGTWGVMLDDVLAGVYAAAVVLLSGAVLERMNELTTMQGL